MRRAFLACAVAAGLSFAGAAAAEPFFALTNAHVTVAFDASGAIASLRERAGGRELLPAANRTPFAFARLAGGRAVPTVGLEPRGRDLLVWRFDGGLGELRLSVLPFDGGWTFRVDGCTVRDALSVDFLRVRPACHRWTGFGPNMYSDERSAVCLRAYQPALAMSALAHECLKVEAAAARGYGGLAAGLFAGPRAALVPALQAMTRAAGVAPSAHGGAWALASSKARASYLFANTLAVTNVDAWIALARLGGFGTLHHERWYGKLGHYPPRADLFPRGFSDLRRVADRVNAAGLQLGMHTLTAGIGLSDPWVTPEPHPDLHGWCAYELARPFRPGDTEIVVTDCPKEFHDTVFNYSSRGNFLRIGREIVQYSGIRRERPFAFTGIGRGACGTARGGAYPAGTRLDYLHCRYAMFFPKPHSALQDDLAAAIASAFDRGGFDQLYFDGADCGLGSPYEVDLMCRKIYDRLGRKPVAEGGGLQHVWWWRSRAGTWDYPNWAPKRFHDFHIESVRNLREAELLVPQVGWWRPKAADGVSRGFFTDEVEYFAGKNAALDATCSMDGLDPACLSDYTRRLVGLFGVYERFRRSHAFSDEALRRLGEPGREFRLRERDGVWTLAPVEMAHGRLSGTKALDFSRNFETGSETVFRLVALYNPQVRGLSPRPLHGGGLKEEVHAAPYLGLRNCRALVGRVRGDGSDAILRLRLVSPREYGHAVSDHFLRVDFTGWRDVVFDVRERDAGGIDGYRPPRAHTESFRAPLDVNHLKAVSWAVVRGNAGPGLEVAPFAAVPSERGSGHRFAVTVNGVSLEIPFVLSGGDFVECENGRLVHWSEDGRRLGETGVGALPRVKRGRNAFGVASPTGSRAELTVMAVGESFPALRLGGSNWSVNSL